MKRRHLLREAVSKEQLDDAIETLKGETKYNFDYDAAEDVWKITDPKCNGRLNCGWKIANKLALIMRMPLDKFYEVYEPIVFDNRVEIGVGLFDTEVSDDAEIEVAENRGYHQDRYGAKLSVKDIPPELSDVLTKDFCATIPDWDEHSRIPHLMVLIPTMRHNPEYDTHTGRGRKPMEQIPNMTYSRRRELEAAIIKAGWKIVSMDSPGEISDDDEWVYEIAPKDMNQTEYFQVAESAKVTLTVGQIKKLIKESRATRMNESTDPVPGKKYDYYAAVKSDLEEFITDYIESGDITTREDLMTDSDRIKDEAVNSYVTGAGNGHYFNDSFKAEEAICHNWDLMQEVTEEWGDDELFKKSPSGVDISIRTYVLYMVFDGVLEQIANGYPSESDDIEVADYDDTGI